jgi:hypothetical protein
MYPLSTRVHELLKRSFVRDTLCSQQITRLLRVLRNPTHTRMSCKASPARLTKGRFHFGDAFDHVLPCSAGISFLLFKLWEVLINVYPL